MWKFICLVYIYNDISLSDVFHVAFSHRFSYSTTLFSRSKNDFTADTHHLRKLPDVEIDKKEEIKLEGLEGNIDGVGYSIIEIDTRLNVL